MVVLIVICFIATVLLLWFRTDAWIEYTRLFHLNFLSFYKDFDQKYKEDVMLTYIDYLRRNHNCFFVRLITCPVCQSVWWGVIFGLFTGVFLTPIYIIGGLTLYLIINRLLE
jgi:hypothetical protein